MHRMGILVGFILLLASSALAQDTSRFQVETGYQYDRFYAEPGKGVNCSGGSAQMDWFFARDFALVGDLGICDTSDVSPYIHGIPNGTNVGATLLTYQFGPKFAWRSNRRLEPFAQVLFGGASASVYCSNCVSEIGGFDGIKNATISATFNSIGMAAGGGGGYTSHQLARNSGHPGTIPADLW